MFTNGLYVSISPLIQISSSINVMCNYRYLIIIIIIFRNVDITIEPKLQREKNIPILIP